ncbi:putative cardiolipin synthase YwiE [Thalassocella blandensis]|nr:putative cardiolipin synthase YwiE [Thalassocella blandensis]
MVILLVHIILALTATWMLFRHPYLKLTNLGWILGIWLIPLVGAVFFFITVVGSVSRGRSANFEKLRKSQALQRLMWKSSYTDQLAPEGQNPTKITSAENQENSPDSAGFEASEGSEGLESTVDNHSTKNNADDESKSENPSCEIKATAPTQTQRLSPEAQEGKGPACSGFAQINQLGCDLGYLPYFCMDEYKVYRDKAFIPAFFAQLRQAKKRIWVSTYIFSGDVRQEFLSILEEAYERGVDVRLMLDRYGSEMMFLSKAKELWLRDYRFPIFVFRDSTLKSYLYIEKRLHSKIALIDEDTAFIGSHNIRDEAFKESDDFAHNISVQMSGTVVDQLSAVYADLWFYNVKREQRVLDIQEHLTGQCESQAGEHTPLPARIIFSEPLARSGIYQQYLSSLLLSARKRIYIWSPYVIPSNAMRQILIGSKRLNVDVRILVPQKTDSKIVDLTHKLVLKEFVDAGIPCVAAPGHFDHSKVIIVDDVVIIGSTNFDYRSIYRNYEANIEVYDREFADQWQKTFNEKFERESHITSMRHTHFGRIRSHLISLVAGLY